jgi:hypothetical protein
MYKLSRKYPDCLCRIPLFLPIKKREPLEDKELKCPWGTVKFPTVPLTMMDEAVFLTVLNDGEYNKEFDRILYVPTTIYDCTRNMGKTGSTAKIVLDSIKTLTETIVEFSVKDYDDFSDTLLKLYVFEGVNIYENPKQKFVVSAHPIFSRIMKHNTEPQEVVINNIRKMKKLKQKGTIRHINMELRSKLSSTGQALLRFICGHKIAYDYKFSLKHVLSAIAPHMRKDHFKSVLKVALAQLVELRFLTYGYIKKEGRQELVYYRRESESKKST